MTRHMLVEKYLVSSTLTPFSALAKQKTTIAGGRIFSLPKENLPVTTEQLSEHLPGYSIRDGHIVNSKGKVVSKGYHGFETFRVGDAVALIGRLGAIGRILRVPANEDGFFEESEADFHDLTFDKETGLLLASTGAKSHIVDPVAGKKVSSGHHSYFWKEGELYGRIGTGVYLIRLEGTPYLGEGPKQLK